MLHFGKSNHATSMKFAQICDFIKIKVYLQDNKDINYYFISLTNSFLHISVCIDNLNISKFY